jgi:hypothetical protein
MSTANMLPPALENSLTPTERASLALAQAAEASRVVAAQEATAAEELWRAWAQAQTQARGRDETLAQAWKEWAAAAAETAREIDAAARQVDAAIWSEMQALSEARKAAAAYDAEMLELAKLNTAARAQATVAAQASTLAAEAWARWALMGAQNRTKDYGPTPEGEASQ